MSEINAIATNNFLLATQQEVSHDNTLSGNGTVDSPLGVVPGYNETVLYSGQATGNLTLSDNPLNYERLLVTFNASTGNTDMGAGSEIFEPDKTHLVCLHNYFMYQTTQTAFNNMNEAWAVYSGVDTTTWTRTIGGWRNGSTYTSNLNNSNNFLKVSKVIGINRISGNE
jgi:hypothetical protein